MQKILAALLAICTLGFAPAGALAQDTPTGRLQAQLDSNPHIRALLISRGGKDVFAYYRADTTPETPLHVASVTKSIVSLLAGIAQERRALTLDESLSAFFPEFATDDRLGKVRLRHVMSMASGFDRRGLDFNSDYNDFVNHFYSPSLLQAALGRKLVKGPGEEFYYSNIDSQLVAMVVARRVQMPLDAFAEKALFGPLGIVKYSWEKTAGGVANGAAGLMLTAPDMVKIGRMVMAAGQWQGQQVVPAAYLREATSHKVDTPMIPPRGRRKDLWGYGYLWWLASTPGDELPAFYASGYGGQLIYVVPALDLVIVAVTQQVSRDVAARTNLLVRDYALPAAR